MITCKDCRKRNNCFDEHKSYKCSDDGDSWAYWCDDYSPRHKHKSKEVRLGGLVAYQSGYNYHIHIYDEYSQELVLHSACGKRVSKRKLRKMIRYYKQKIFESALKSLLREERGIDERLRTTESSE